MACPPLHWKTYFIFFLYQAGSESTAHKETHALAPSGHRKMLRPKITAIAGVRQRRSMGGGSPQDSVLS